MYDPGLGRWMTVDPMVEHRYRFSSYDYCGNNPLLFVDPDGALDTHYIDEYDNVILQTDDGSDDVVRISRDRMSEFLSVLKASLGDAGRLNSREWNDYWKGELGLADVQFGKEELSVLSMFNTKWSRHATAAYLLKPTGRNALRMGFSEGLSQWTNPEIVVPMLSLDIARWQGIGGKVGERNAKLPVGRRGDVLEEFMEGVPRNTPTVINRTKFTGHALNQMQNREIISPTAVLDVVKNPAKVISGNKPGTFVYFRDDLKVITNKLGDIISVMWQ